MSISNTQGLTEPQNQKPVNPLRVRNFRLLWIGESISMLGDQFAMIALPWLVLRLNGNGLALGTVMAMISIPRALFMLVGGALVDRFSPRVVMLASNFLRLVLFTLLTLLVVTNHIQLWMLYLFGLAFGVADAFYFPGQTAILPQILESDQLQFGNMLIQGMAQLSLFVGPVLAGLFIALFSQNGGTSAAEVSDRIGIGCAFGLDALSFLASLTALWLIVVAKPRRAAETKANVLTSIKDGAAYVWNSADLRMLLLLVMALNFLFMGPFSVGVPVLANKRLAEEAAAYGLIMSAFGGGSLAGIVLAGTLPRPKPAYFGTLMLSITALLGIGLILLPLTVSTPVITLISLVMGIMDGYIFISMMTWLQKRIPGELMGRVMSLIMLASVGLAPVSSTLAGAVLDINLVGLFVAAGILMTSLALFFAATPIARQIGLETAASSDAPRSG